MGQAVTDTPPAEDPRPFPSYLSGEAADRYTRAVARWRESGYDDRLKPTPNPTPERQAFYDAWDRGAWPPEAGP